jgi:hypothetical protein
MAWNAPITWTLQQVVTSAQLNSQIRDNLLQTAPAKATTASGYFVGTAPNTITERVIGHAIVTAQQTGTATGYGNLATVGPTVTVTTGPSALVFTSAQLENSGNGSTWASYGITGATTDAITDERAIFNQSGSTFGGRFGVTTWQSLTPGSNTFLMQYRVSSGTGTYDDRSLIVMGF